MVDVPIESDLSALEDRLSSRVSFVMRESMNKLPGPGSAKICLQYTDAWIPTSLIGAFSDLQIFPHGAVAKWLLRLTRMRRCYIDQNPISIPFGGAGSSPAGVVSFLLDQRPLSPFFGLLKGAQWSKCDQNCHQISIVRSRRSEACQPTVDTYRRPCVIEVGTFV